MRKAGIYAAILALTLAAGAMTVCASDTENVSESVSEDITGNAEEIMTEEETEDLTEDMTEESEAIYAPDFTVYNAEGEQVSLSDMAGKPVIINFWATWCPPCRSELGYFEEAYKTYGDEIEFMMVDLTDGTEETVEGVQAFAEENGYTFPVYYDLDADAAYTYGIYAIPVTIAVNGDGTVSFGRVGAIEQETLQEIVDMYIE